MRLRRPRKDANQDKIVEALRAAGCTVVITSGVGDGFPDLVVGRENVTYLLDVKAPGGKPTPKQLGFLAKWRGGSMSFPMTPDEALRIVGALRHKSMFATKPL